MGWNLALTLFLAAPALLAQTTIFTITEQTGRHPISHDPSHPNEDVDINSAVILKPNKTDILARIRPRQILQDTTQKLQAVTRILSLRNKNLKDLDDFRSELTQMPKGDRTSQRDRILAKLQSVSSDQQQVNGLTEAYVRQNHPHIADSLLDGFATDSKQYGAFLAEEIQNLQNELKTNQNQYALRLELTATLPPGTPAVHIENYDTNKPGAPLVVDKTRFTFDDAFQAEADAAKQFSQAITKGKSLQATTLSAIQADLPKIQEQVQTVADALTKLKVNLPPADGGTKVPQDLTMSETRIATVLKQVASLGKLAETRSGTADPAPTLNAMVDPLKAIEANLETLAASASRLGKTITSQDKRVAGPLSDDLVNLQATMDSLVAVAQVDRIASAPVPFPGGAIALPLDNAVDGRIDLTTTARKEGDVLSIRARVYPAAAGEGDPPLLEQQASLTIRKSGWVAVTGGAIHFVKVKDDPRNTYVTAPSAYAVYRYQGWQDQKGYRFWKVFAPGLGIATAAVPMADGSTRIGVMGTVQFFKDILQVSWGTTPSRDRLFSIGIGLQQLLGVGKTF